MYEQKKACCFFGHRRVENIESLRSKVYKTVEELILNHGVETFLFGSKSEFDYLCRSVVADLKEKFPHIKRVYVRAEYMEISENYEKYLLEDFEETYFPKRAVNSGKAVYLERNYEMIDKSDFCIVYLSEDYLPPERKQCKKDLFSYQPNSGTKLAFNYAVKKNRKLINIAEI